MAELIARIWLAARRRAPGDFVSDCCHRIDDRLRAGPPTTRTELRN
jgi:hypothetical protein